MSQVIIQDDDLSELRRQSKTQEQAIKVNKFVEHWRKSDISTPSIGYKMLAVPAVALGLMFAILLGLGSIVWAAFTQILKVLGSLFK